MEFEKALSDELLSIPELSNKVFPLNAQEGIKAPYLIFVSSFGLEDKTLDGYLNTKEVPCEVNILHTTYGEMRILTFNIISKIKSFQDRIIGTGGPLIRNVTYEEPVEIYESAVDLYRCVINVKFSF